MKVITSTLIVFIVSYAALGQTPAAGSEQFRAFWVDAVAGHDGLKTPAQVDQLVADAKRANVNAIIAQVWRRGGALFLKTSDPRYEDSTLMPGFDALQYLIDRAHAEKIEVHAWLNALALWSGSTPPVSPNHAYNLHGAGKTGSDYWLSRTDTGAENSADGIFLDPGNRGASDYVARIYIDLVKNYDVDGIHFDFIRYAGQEWGFNPTSIDRFNLLNKRTGVPAKNDSQWMAWRREQVTAIVRRVYLSVAALKPNVKVSAATIAFGNGPVAESDWLQTSAYTSVFQDWRAWTQEGILDFPVVMNYDRETDANQKVWFDRWIEWDKNHRYNRHVVIGQGAFLNSVADSMAQTHRALAPSSSGNYANGVAFFSYATTNKDSRPNGEFYSSLATQDSNNPAPVFAEPATTPEMPWKISPQVHLMGRVTLPGGEPLDGARVTLAALAPAPPLALNRQTDGNGFFGWVNISAVSYSVFVELDDKAVKGPLSLDLSNNAGVMTLNIALDELPAPVIAVVGFAKKRLTVTGRFFDGTARVEVNGKLVEQEVSFDSATGTLIIRGKRKKLGLSEEAGANRVVVIIDGKRSESFTF